MGSILHFKTFELNGISELEILKTIFREKYNYNISEMFNKSSGIINDISSAV
jgi:hypothetical protein